MGTKDLLARLNRLEDSAALLGASEPAGQKSAADQWEPMAEEDYHRVGAIISRQFGVALYHLWADKHWRPEAHPPGSWHRLTMEKDLALLSILNRTRERTGATPLDHASLWATDRQEWAALVEDCLEALEPEAWSEVFNVLSAELLEAGYRISPTAPPDCSEPDAGQS